MVSRKSFLSFLCVALVAGVTVWADDVKLEGVKCVVAPKAANASKSAEYKDGKVYFCCGNCAGKFAESPEKFATAANMQLVATKQYEQKACPFSGGDLNAETKIKVGDAEVSFCCNNCKGKVEAAEPKEQAEMVFSDKAFKKAGFAKVAAK
jgi:YHS domain-containing protein